MAKSLSNTFEWIEHNLNIAKAGDFTIREGNSFNILGGEIPLGQPFAIFIDIGQEAQDVNSGSLFDYSIRPAIFALDNTLPRHITGSGSESFNLNGLYTGTTQKIYRLKIVENSAGTFTQSGNNITGIDTNFHDAMAPLSIFGATNLAGATITSVTDSTHLVVDGPSRTVSEATTFLITPNSVVYQVSTDGGNTFAAYDLDDAINCSTSEVALTEGLTIQCHSITAFTEGNEWEFWTPMPQRVEIAVQTTGSGEALTTAVKSVTTQLAEALTDTALTVDVDAGHGIAVNDVIAIDSEKMLVTTVSTNTLTITRGYGKRAGFDGPGSPAVHADNSKVQLVVTASHRQVFVVKIIDGDSDDPNTFKYSTDGGVTFDNGGGSTDGSDPINVPAGTHTLRRSDNSSYGITIAFSATTGYTDDDAFSFHAFPITPFPKWEGNSERVLLGWVQNQGGSKPLKRQFLSGAALQTSETVVDASFTASLMRKGIQSWSTDIRFEGTDFNDLRWYQLGGTPGSTAGSVSFADNTTEAITAGANPTGLGVGTHYIYKLVGASANATLQITSNYSLVYTDEAILLATVVVVTDAGQPSPTIFPFNGNQGTISAGVISAGAILADRIKANDIDADQITVGYKPTSLSSVDNDSTSTIRGGVTGENVSSNMAGVTMTSAGNIYSTYNGAAKSTFASHNAVSGYFLGFDTSSPAKPVFNIGDATSYFKWDGSDVKIAGTIEGATTLTLGGAGAGGVVGTPPSTSGTTGHFRMEDTADTLALRIRAWQNYVQMDVLGRPMWLVITGSGTANFVAPGAGNGATYLGTITDGGSSPNNYGVGWRALTLGRTTHDGALVLQSHATTTNQYTFTFPQTVPGTSGYILSSDTSGNTSWIAPPTTTYTAGTGLTLSSTEFSLTSPVTVATGGTELTSLTKNKILIGNDTGTPHLLDMGTKGHIMIGRPTNVFPSPLAVGSTNQILTADDQEPLGVKWAAPAASVTSIVAGDNISISGATGAVTITATGSSGTVTSIATTSPISGGTITGTGTISHLNTAGNKHIPTSGSSGQFLKYSSSGTAVWATPSYTTNTDTIYAGWTIAGVTGDTEAITSQTVAFHGSGGITTAYSAYYNTLTIDGAGVATLAHPDPIILGLGAKAAPTYTFSGDADTGMYRAGTNILGFTVGGNKRITLDSWWNLWNNAEDDITAYVIAESGNGRFDGTLSVGGALYKGSGSFLIDHPLDKPNKDLYHGFVEAPNYDLLYRGTVTLSSGTATVNIDTSSSMTSGTFAALTQNPEVWVQNKTGWTALRGSVSGATLTITAQDTASTDTVAWMVIAERADDFIKGSDTTDADGHLIPERNKAAQTADEAAHGVTKGTRGYPRHS